MIKLSTYLFIGVILTIAESSAVLFFSMEFFKPDFGMPLLVYTTLFLGPVAGLITSSLMGILQEILSSAPAGSVVFTKVATFIVAVFLRSQLFVDSRYSFACVTGGFVIVESALFILLSLLAKGETKDIWNVLVYMFPNAAVTGFISLPLFSLIEYLNVKLLAKEQ